MTVYDKGYWEDAFLNRRLIIKIKEITVFVERLEQSTNDLTDLRKYPRLLPHSPP